jgi:antimicrobial peptide system SdpA family protein
MSTDSTGAATPAGAAPPERLGAIVVALAVLGALVCGYVVHAQIPTNAVQLPYETSLSRQVRLVLPQGWAFFTRSPRQPDVVPYVRVDGRWRLALRTPNAEPRNLFGLSRTARAQGVEMGVLVGGLRPTDWLECGESPIGCLDRPSPIAARNTSLTPSLCGQVGLVSQQPLPWAWSGAREQTTMPSNVARLDVSC